MQPSPQCCSIESTSLLNSISKHAFENSSLHMQRTYDFIEVCGWFAARCDLILLLFDPAKLDISDEMKQVSLPHFPACQMLAHSHACLLLHSDTNSLATVAVHAFVLSSGPVSMMASKMMSSSGRHLDQLWSFQ